MEKNQRQIGRSVAHNFVRTGSRIARPGRTVRKKYVLTPRCICAVILIAVTIAIASVIIASTMAAKTAAAAATLEEQEYTALELNVELSRLGSSGDPLEREALLLQLTRECPDVEGGQAAYWALSNLYLDDFDESDEARAREVLERFLKNYPSSRWTTQVKCRLLVLCEREDKARAAQLRSELLKSGQLPNMIRITMQ